MRGLVPPNTIALEVNACPGLNLFVGRGVPDHGGCMPRDGQTISYTGEEALAVTLWQNTKDEYYEQWTALFEQFKDDAAVKDRLNAMEPMIGDIVVQWTHVLHARLTRVLPHLADIVTYLCFQEFMGMPGWVEQRGLPLPWVNAGRQRMVGEEDDT